MKAFFKKHKVITFTFLVLLVSLLTGFLTFASLSNVPIETLEVVETAAKNNGNILDNIPTPSKSMYDNIIFVISLSLGGFALFVSLTAIIVHLIKIRNFKRLTSFQVEVPILDADIKDLEEYLKGMEE